MTMLMTMTVWWWWWWWLTFIQHLCPIQHVRSKDDCRKLLQHLANLLLIILLLSIHSIIQLIHSTIICWACTKALTSYASILIIVILDRVLLIEWRGKKQINQQTMEGKCTYALCINHLQNHTHAQVMVQFITMILPVHYGWTLKSKGWGAGFVMG